MDESFFQTLLDVDANGSAVHAIFAEWLAERGDPRAFGYRWMAVHGKRPRRGRFNDEVGEVWWWDWWSIHSSGPAVLPTKIWERLLRITATRYEYLTRQEAEEDLCRVVLNIYPFVGQ